MNKLSIIIPVYWNANTLKDLYDDIKTKVLDKLEEYELVFVDDGSGDNSWDIINEIRNIDSNVKAVKLSRNFGEHAAIYAGLSVCSGDCAVTKQADLQEDSLIIINMYESWKNGNKVVLATRYAREDNISTKFFAGLYYKMIRKFIFSKMPEGGCDCFLIDKQVIQSILSRIVINSSLILQILWSGFKTDVIYYKRLERKDGKGRWTFSKKMKLTLDSIFSFSYLPIRITWIVGILFFLFSIIMTIYVIIDFFKFGDKVPGWPTVMCILLASSGLILWTLGVLGEYIWRTFDASRNRPPFIIEEVK